MGDLLAQPHHDGSEAYVLEPPTDLGDDATVLLRVPASAPADAVVVRFVHDGEPRYAVAEKDRETASDTWWRATFRVDNPMTPYRWLLSGGSYGYAWLNGTGVQPFDVTDADDFVVTPGAGGPEWHLESVVYEVFPDRFASSGLDVDPARVGGSARLGRAADRAWAGHPVRVVRRRPARRRGAPRPL